MTPKQESDKRLPDMHILRRDNNAPALYHISVGVIVLFLVIGHC